jgi:hypothetical protein
MRRNHQITNMLGALAIALMCIVCGLFSGGDLNRPIEPDFWRFMLLLKAGMLLVGVIFFASACLALFRYIQTKSE